MVEDKKDHHDTHHTTAEPAHEIATNDTAFHVSDALSRS